MRTLDEIVAAIRSGRPYTKEEAAYTVVAFDVLLAQLALDQDAPRLQHWMSAATQSPKEYIGPANDPANPDATSWYISMHDAGVFKCPDCNCLNPGDIEADHTDCIPF